MEALQIMPIMAQNQSKFNLGEYAEEAAIIQDEPTVQPSVNFLEANTDAITMDELTNKCVVLAMHIYSTHKNSIVSSSPCENRKDTRV